ncbi:MAG: thioredoxin family protein [ANME-2 cluster archaeon]|nr:thioredoxin family protein [ANME-2 cluster archaeon]
MRTSDRMILKCFISLLLLVTGTATAENPQSLSVEINTNLNNNIPVFVYFYSDFCHFCQEQTPIINELEVNYFSKIAFIHINLDENFQDGIEFNVSRVPTTLLITDKDERGKFVYQKFQGVKNSTTLSSSFDQAIANISISPDKTTQTSTTPSWKVAMILVLILIVLGAVLLYEMRH